MPQCVESIAQSLLAGSGPRAPVPRGSLRPEHGPGHRPPPWCRRGIARWAHDLQIPLTVQASGGISHDFGRGVTVSADTVFARGFDQYVIGDVNIDLEATRQQRRIVRINPNYSFINRYGNDGRFVYRSLQLQASFAPSRGTG